MLVLKGTPTFQRFSCENLNEKDFFLSFSPFTHNSSYSFIDPRICHEKQANFLYACLHQEIVLKWNILFLKGPLKLA